MVSTSLKDWKEVTKGIYRYAISANAAYEIHINYWDMETEILTADASLYIVGDWRLNDGRNIRERVCLLSSELVTACLDKAVEGDRENNS